MTSLKTRIDDADKIAIVTGVPRGISRAIARERGPLPFAQFDIECDD